MLFSIKVFLLDGTLLGTFNYTEWYDVQFQLYRIFERQANILRYEIYRDGELIIKNSRG